MPDSAATPGRHLPLDGVHNFRDYGDYAVAGGGRVKPGLLWRSAQHRDATDADLARIAALKQCKGQCTTITMKRACAALAVDMSNPCGAHGYAVKPRISSSLNAATRKCYEYGGKDCVIRAWACDARG